MAAGAKGTQPRGPKGKGATEDPAKHKAAKAAPPARTTAVAKRKREEEEEEEEDEDGDFEDLEAEDEDDMLEEEEEEEEEGEQAQQRKGGKKQGGASAFLPPTNDELRSMKETEQLFKSNVFKLQVEELLKEATVSYPKMKKLEGALHSLKAAIEGFPAIPEKKIEQARKDLAAQKVEIPFSFPEGISGNFGLEYQPPQSVDLVGSYLLRANTKPVLNVDVAVEMPEGLFRNKDHLNYCYFYKRAYYLAVLAANLRKTKQFSNLSFVAFNGNLLRPILEIRAAKDHSEQDFSKSGFVIRLIPSVPSSVFSASRLAPLRNSIRNPLVQEDCLGVPTPQYHADILADMNFKEHLALLHQHLQGAPGMLDAIVLGKVWLHQRHMSQELGSVDGFLLSMLTVYLVQQRVINRQMSSYQILRLLMQFIATHDISEHPLALKVQEKSNLEGYEISAFKQAFELVFVDGSGKLNMLSKMSRASWEELRHQARMAQEELSETLEDTFEALFLKKQHAELKYDELFEIRDVSGLTSERLVGSPQRRLELYDQMDHVSRAISGTLREGLGERARYIRGTLSRLPSWKLSEPAPLPTAPRSLALALALHPTKAFGLVDHGPPADDEARASKFRAFWGKKAELRRFQDGSILEAVVWDKLKDRREEIVERSIRYQLKHLFGVRSERVGAFMTSHLRSPLLSRMPATPRMAEAFTPPIHAFGNLSKYLRELALPLSISNIQTTSPTLRYTEPYIPLPDGQYLPSNKWAPVLDVSIQFEMSGQWPDDLRAIKNTKTAFYLKIAKLMDADNISTVVTERWIDVLFDGYMFRIRIYHHRELVLMEKQGLDKNAAELRREFIQRPALASSIHNISNEHGSFSTAVRLAKRWVHAHLFSGLLCAEAIELMVASLYVNRSSYEVPTSPLAGFLRFLDLLAHFDWANQPLVVNLDRSLTAEAQTEIHHHFTKSLESAPSAHPTFYLASPLDKTSSHWTAHSPNKPVALRIILLASKALSRFQESLAKRENLDIKSLFLTPTRDFNLLIKLVPRALSRQYQGVGFDEESQPQKGFLPPYRKKYGFDEVACLVGLLKETYGDFALFFYDEEGGDTIGVAFRPAAFLPSPLQVSTSFGKFPLSLDFSDKAVEEAVRLARAGKGEEPPQKKRKGKEGERMVLPDIFALLTGIRHLGQGLIKDLVMQL